MEELKKLNLFYSLLHGLSAFVVAYAFAFSENPRMIDLYRGAIPNDLLYPEINCNGTTSIQCPKKYSNTPIDRNKSINFPLICQKTSSVDPALYLFLFFGITAFAHLLYATDVNQFYTKAIKEGWNPYRWFEYATTASIMIFLISILDNERNINAVTLLTFMTAVTQYQGYIVENTFLLRNLSKTQSDIVWRTVRYATFSGWLLFVGVWYVLIRHFINTLNDANALILHPTDKKVKIPVWVYGVVFSQAFYFGWFGWVQHKQINDHKDGVIKPYEVYEKQYLSLSFYAKFALGAFVTYGIINRINGNN